MRPAQCIGGPPVVGGRYPRTSCLPLAAARLLPVRLDGPRYSNPRYVSSVLDELVCLYALWDGAAPAAASAPAFAPVSVSDGSALAPERVRGAAMRRCTHGQTGTCDGARLLKRDFGGMYTQGVSIPLLLRGFTSIINLGNNRKGDAMRCICVAVMECWFQMGAGEEGGLYGRCGISVLDGGDPKIWYTRGALRFASVTKSGPNMI